MPKESNWRIALLAIGIVLVDQLTKLIVLSQLGFAEQREVVKGFLRFVHWQNTGAAWSMFTGNNGALAVVAIVALVGLVLARRYFDAHTVGGQTSLGLILGGITGNVIDRLLPSRQHVIDFIYFYVVRRDGTEVGFPAFNVADSAICIGVGLLFVLSWRRKAGEVPENASANK
jgi:signal peptidase II